MIDALEVLEELIQLLQSGMSIRHARAQCISRISDQNLATQVDAILTFARRVGGSAVPALRTLADSLRADRENELAIENEAASPNATARLVFWLPVLAFAAAQLFGLPLVQSVMQSLVAKVSIGFGVLLLVIGSRWSRRLARLKPIDSQTSIQLELFAAALKSGLQIRAATELVSPGLEVREMLVEMTRSARRGGLPLAEMLTNRAAAMRREQQAKRLGEIRRLGVRLLIPVGVTALPALVFLLVVPLGLGLTVASQTSTI